MSTSGTGQTSQDSEREPCGNGECDRCYPQPRFVLRQDSVRRVRYQVIVKAATREEALAMLADGTCQGAEPTSYNECDLQLISEEPGVALTHEEAYPDRDHQRDYWLNRCCYHDILDRREERGFLENKGPADDEYTAPGFDDDLEQPEPERPETD